jgi:hypothetical protein
MAELMFSLPFVRILKAALERQRHSGHPVCVDHEPATAGEDQTLRGALGHGCLLVAETGCEARDFGSCAHRRHGRPDGGGVL